MAYAESTIGGNYGGSFRVWVNSVQVYQGGPNENYEQWRVDGGINRISTTGGTIYSSGASFNIQLGMNGMATSGGFSYNYNTATGTKNSWSSGTTTVYRDGAGLGFVFQSRTDVNLNNSPYLTSGWVTSDDKVRTVYRHATFSAFSIDQGGITFTDEGPAWVEFNNPSGTAVDAWIEINGVRVYTSGSVGSRFNYPWSQGLIDAIDQASPNSNTYNVRIGIHDSMGGDNWDYRDRTGYIQNNNGQANPVFSTFTFLDTNATTTAVTGNNQVLIQGKSNLQVNIAAANKAVAKKFATMSSYLTTIGSYSQSDAFSSSADITRVVGIVTGVTGVQNISVRAIDSRGNNATATQSTTVLPYASPAITSVLTVAYSNNFDTSNGITVSSPSSVIANISPLTLSGTDKNSVVAASGIKFDISKGNNTSYTGTWVNIPTTQAAGTGVITTDLTALATSILNKINGLTADNTVRWYIKFQINDKLETQYYETYIDIGRPIMRIGADGYVYFNEVAYQSKNQITTPTGTAPFTITPVGFASNNQYFITALSGNTTFAAPSGTPVNGNRLVMRIRDNGTARTLAWDAIYRGVGAILPTTTTANKSMYVGFIYNDFLSKWDCLAVNVEV